MEDSRIIELYWERDEDAIVQSKKKYGTYCKAIASNILHSNEDAEECLSDTWVRAWNSIPPEKPGRLAVFLGKITRNLAIDRYRKEHSQKSGGGQLKLCLDELGECIGEQARLEDSLALRELLSDFLSSIPQKNKDIFLLRYWYMIPIDRIAGYYGLSQGAVKMMLKRTRNKLREYLEKEGELE